MLDGFRRVDHRVFCQWSLRNLRGPVHAAISFTGTGSRIYVRARKSIVALSAFNMSPAAASAAAEALAIKGPVLSAADSLSWDGSNMSTYLTLDPRTPSIVRNTGSSDKWQCVTSKQVCGVFFSSSQFYAFHLSNRRARFIPSDSTRAELLVGPGIDRHRDPPAQGQLEQHMVFLHWRCTGCIFSVGEPKVGRLAGLVGACTVHHEFTCRDRILW